MARSQLNKSLKEISVDHIEFDAYTFWVITMLARCVLSNFYVSYHIKEEEECNLADATMNTMKLLSADDQ